MSSQATFTSSPIPRSRFTYKHLSLLSASIPTCPLRVVAHIDLDAFYAQCEIVRLGLPPSTPLAVQQWSGLIAINYPARSFGITRHMDVKAAREKCPELVAQHVATWKEGDTSWEYRIESMDHIATHKVSLDPYRRESKKILACIRETLPQGTKVEKASIDEVFVDLSSMVHKRLLERYPDELQAPPPYGDVGEELPRPPSAVLDWSCDAIVDLNEEEREEDDPDWDDVCMVAGAEIVREVRAAVFEKLKYTCSAGIARNKMLAKLGSGHKKPNSQTVVRNRAVGRFLGDLKFTKIRNLGGKLGEMAVEKFGADTVKEILGVTLDQMKRKLGDDTGSWLYQVIRGNDVSEVNPRTQIKSMLSAKSFRPSINSFEQGARWLRIFVADIFSRLVEEGVLENRRRPKTINLHHRHTGLTKSRSAPIPQGRPIDESSLFELAKTLLTQIIAEGDAWPCANLSLSVGGFEDGVTGNQGIGSFLVKGEEARNLISWSAKDGADGSGHVDSNKKRKLLHSDEGSMDRYLANSKLTVATTPAKDKPDDDAITAAATASSSRERHVATTSGYQSLPHRSPSKRSSGTGASVRHLSSDGDTTATEKEEPQATDHAGHKEDEPDRPLSPAATTEEIDNCHHCGKHVPRADRPQHDDWHFAKRLEAEERELGSREDNVHGSLHSSSDKAKSGAQSTRKRRGRPPGSSSSSNGAGNMMSGKVHKGQRRLAFG